MRQSYSRAQGVKKGMNHVIYQCELSSICKIIFWGQLGTEGDKGFFGGLETLGFCLFVCVLFHYSVLSYSLMRLTVLK